MKTIEFQHNGRNYSVQPLTEFQKSLSFAWMADVCKDVTGDEWENAPLSTRRLVSWFINLSLSTKIDGVSFNPITSATKDEYLSFANSIVMDTELQALWSNTYDEVNLKQVDPNASSVEPPVENA